MFLSRHSLKSGHTPEQTGSKTPTVEMTPTTTQHSGPSLDESAKRIDQLIGELSALLLNDPYWSVCVSLWRLLSRKRHYYNCWQNPLANAEAVAETGIEPWKYQLARIGEKYRRLGGPLRTIDIQRTLMDIAGHAVIGTLLAKAEEKDCECSQDR